MATSRYDEEQQGARQRRPHRAPRYLDDFIWTYPPQPTNPVPPNTNAATPIHQTAGIDGSPEMERIRRMEQCVTQVQEQMREIQSAIQVSLNFGQRTPQVQLQTQVRSHSMPLLTVDNNPTQAPPMGGLENIPPISPVIPSPQFHTVQQTSPSTAHHVDNPQILQSTAPTLPVNRPIPQPPL